MSSRSRRRLNRLPPQLDAGTRTNRSVRATLVHRKKPDPRALAQALLTLAAHQHGEATGNKRGDSRAETR